MINLGAMGWDAESWAEAVGAEWPQSHNHHHGGYSIWHLVLSLPGGSLRPPATVKGVGYS